MEQPDSSMQPGGVNRGLDFDLGVESSRFKFSCAHFVAYPGFRERLHGHNYTLAFKIGGPVGNEGYIVRAEELNDVVRDFCKSLNEYFIVPMKSDVLTIRMEEKSVYIRTETGDDFMFPIGDCKLLPLLGERPHQQPVGVRESRGREYHSQPQPEEGLPCLSAFATMLWVDRSSPMATLPAALLEGAPGWGSWTQSTDWVATLPVYPSSTRGWADKSACTGARPPVFDIRPLTSSISQCVCVCACEYVCVCVCVRLCMRGSLKVRIILTVEFRLGYSLIEGKAAYMMSSR
eukprot:GHVU01197486.1.p1 GENE.GHVU01197486.1~~GHVU01197486.1.p1  ORF type:complete len:290 (+),score=31.75 GHVU01197486.1:522-1391(+)